MRATLLLFAFAVAIQVGSAPVPDFRLSDVSLASPRRGSTVSPRDYILQVSGYYFGAAT